MLHELYKGKGKVNVCDSWRDVLLSDEDSKGLSRIIRKKLLPHVVNMAMSTQFGGGINGGECAFAHLYLRLVSDWAQVNRSSIATLFLDVCSAFATMLRRIIFCHEDGDEAWLHKLASVGFSLEEIKAIYDDICAFAWHAECSDHDDDYRDELTYEYASTLFEHNWISQDTLPNVLRIKVGCGAGTPIADLIYSLSMSRVLISLRECLASKGLGSSMHF